VLLLVTSFFAKPAALRFDNLIGCSLSRGKQVKEPRSGGISTENRDCRIILGANKAPSSLWMTPTLLFCHRSISWSLPRVAKVVPNFSFASNPQQAARRCGPVVLCCRQTRPAAAGIKSGVYFMVRIRLRRSYWWEVFRFWSWRSLLQNSARPSCHASQIM
jgi:hypothetical protein